VATNAIDVHVPVRDQWPAHPLRHRPLAAAGFIGAVLARHL